MLVDLSEKSPFLNEIIAFLYNKVRVKSGGKIGEVLNICGRLALCFRMQVFMLPYMMLFSDCFEQVFGLFWFLHNTGFIFFSLIFL